MKPIRLRPHHFLCMLTYVGKGYSLSFTQNFDRIIERIQTGQTSILVVDGPDDICEPRLCDSSDTSCHCYEDRLRLTDQRAIADLRKISGLEDISVGKTVLLTEGLISSFRKAYEINLIRSACKGCEWFDLCTEIAGNKFKESKLK